MLPFATKSTTCDLPSIYSSSSADPSASAASAASIAKQYATIPYRKNEYLESYKRKRSSRVENERSVGVLEVENGWLYRENIGFKDENESLRRQNFALKDENESLRRQNLALKAKCDQVG